MPPITDVREISSIAHGVIASQVLFATLNAGVFNRLAGGPRPLAGLAEDIALAAHRLETLLIACVSLGLAERTGGPFANAPAGQQYLLGSRGW